MWEDSETQPADRLDNVISLIREQKFEQGVNTVKSIDVEDTFPSGDEDYNKYNTPFASSLTEVSFTQSSPVDAKVNTYQKDSVGGITSTVNTQPQFIVSVHAQTTSDKEDNGKTPVKPEVEKENDSASYSIANNSQAIFSPSSQTELISGITPATDNSVTSALNKEAATYKYIPHIQRLERKSRASSFNPVPATQKSSTQEVYDSEKDIEVNDLHIEEPDFASLKSDGDITREDVFKSSSAYFSQPSSLISSPKSRRTFFGRYGRLTGSESDAIISKEPGSVRVHSQRSGGWEGTPHELVYPLSTDEWRREARRRKWGSQDSKEEEEFVSFVISIERKSSDPNSDCYRTTLQHNTVTVADQNLPYLKPSPGKVNTITFESTPNIYGTDIIDWKMADKEALVERSESFEENSKPGTLKKDNFTPVNFHINPAYPVYAQKSSDEQDTVMSVDYSKGVGPSDFTETSEKEEQSSRSRWDERINPFNEEEPETDEVFTSGIIDLDKTLEESGDTRTSENERCDSESGMIPSKQSLSDAEEQINLKTQFKDAYYNIGSTEDLLKELAAEDERDGDLGVRSKTKSTTSRTDTSDGEVEEKDITEGKTVKSRAARQGKLLKYESLDLDIDQSNPFFDEVYQEYHRRVDDKDESGDKSPTSRKKLADILESHSQEIDEDVPESAASSHKADNEGALAAMSSSGSKDQDSDRLIDQTEDTSKEDKENMPFGFFKKKETEAVAPTPKPEGEAADDKTTKTGDVAENGDATKQTAADGNSSVKVENAADGNVTFNAATTESADGGKVKEGSTPVVNPKTEKSPLIDAEADEAPATDGKESKVRDHSPGFLCCAIL